VDITVLAKTDGSVEGMEGFRVTGEAGTGYTLLDLGGASGGSTADVRISDVPPVALTAAPSPASVGQVVTLTATIGPVPSGVPVPTGTITFYDSGTVLGSGTVSASGVATLTTSALAVGTHTLTAR